MYLLPQTFTSLVLNNVHTCVQYYFEENILQVEYTVALWDWGLCQGLDRENNHSTQSCGGVPDAVYLMNPSCVSLKSGFCIAKRKSGFSLRLASRGKPSPLPFPPPSKIALMPMFVFRIIITEPLLLRPLLLLPLSRPSSLVQNWMAYTRMMRRILGIQRAPQRQNPSPVGAIAVSPRMASSSNVRNAGKASWSLVQGREERVADWRVFLVAHCSVVCSFIGSAVILSLWDKAK